MIAVHGERMVVPNPIERIGVHPAAALFPLMAADSEQFKDLVQSIDEHGLIEPIVTDHLGRVLDGRNRLAACERAGREPRFITFDELVALTGFEGDEDQFVFDRNLARRDLSDDQRAIIVASYFDYKYPHSKALEKQTAAGKEGGRGHKKNPVPKSAHPLQQPKEPKREPTVRQRVAADAGVSAHKAQQALDVARADPDVAQQVADGTVKLRDAAKTVEAKKIKPSTARATRVAKPQNIEVLIDRVAKVIRKAHAQCVVERRVEFVQRIIGITEDLRS